MASQPHHDANEDAKLADIGKNRDEGGAKLTDNLGHAISDDQNSLKAGSRGPSLLEDHLLREKIHHFDHERIPERVVHARGAAAHGFFQVYESLEDITAAKVLRDPNKKTPVFVRFSTVAGSRGSADTARDVRGFAVRLYTDEGNWDIVGNNIPVFFIQDAIKFPDLIHAVKPEPHNEIPQASSAHDTFYDFISLTPESMHMMMWVMSDRALPRSFAMMEGFGVHTFRLINAQGVSRFVKFHWKPLLGVHSLVWDEAQKLAGKDADFHRRAMWESIELGTPFEWELGLQIMEEADESKYDFDILDATKLWPEDLIPVRRVGKMTLNRNPDNYFAETEQVAFMTTNIVPGIDFSDDPLLQGRNFSYLDTQLSRLGSPNWPELPINRPVNHVANYQRDGHMRSTVNVGRVSYEPNSLSGKNPQEVPIAEGGNVTYPEAVSGPKIRVRSESFGDHYGQARLFWNSMSPVEKLHITRAQQFELGKVETQAVRQRMLGHLFKINRTLGELVAPAIGEAPPNPNGEPTDAEMMKLLANAVSETSASGGLQKTSELTQENQPKSAKGRKIAVLATDGANGGSLETLKAALEAAGAVVEVVATHLGELKTADGAALTAAKTLLTTPSVVYDAVVVADGAASVKTLLSQGAALLFVAEAFKHGKAVGASGAGLELLQKAGLKVAPDHGVLDVSSGAADFVKAVAQHRFWNRPDDAVPV